MKTPVAAAISIAGVLFAGSAAAVFNSQVFDGTGTESGASSAILPPPSTVVVSVPEATVPPTVDPTTTTTAPATTTTVVPTTNTGETGMLTAFQVGDAGVVTVDVIEGRLVFVSAEANAGWTIVEDSSDDESGDEVEVVFRSTTVLVELEAELIDGVIVPHVESEAIGGAVPQAGQPPASTASTPTTRYEDDDHDESHDDDHDDDDEDDDDEDDDRDEDDDHEDDDHEDDEDERDDD